MEREPQLQRHRLPILAVSLAVPTALGLLSLWMQEGRMATELWPFDTLPPLFFFYGLRAMLWTVTGISICRIYEGGAPGRRETLRLHAAALVSFFLWTVFYYRFNSLALSFFWMLFLFLLALRLYGEAERSAPNAGKLLLPCLTYYALLAGLLLRLLLPL